jgi:hypothetical protein
MHDTNYDTPIMTSLKYLGMCSDQNSSSTTAYIVYLTIQNGHYLSFQWEFENNEPLLQGVYVFLLANWDLQFEERATIIYYGFGHWLCPNYKHWVLYLYASYKITRNMIKLNRISKKSLAINFGY